MYKYVIKRIVALIPLLFGITVAIFLAINMIPGDPVKIMLGIDATDEMIQELNRQLGLDKPLFVRYFLWLGRLLRGDMGSSITTGLPVWQEIVSRFGVTAQLTFLASLVSLLIAIPLGVISAIKRDSLTDLVVRITALIGISLPGFAIGVLLILLASRQFGWYPPVGFVNIWDEPWVAIQILFMPVIALGTGLAASISRMTRSMMLEVLRQDYVRTARAKGLGEKIVIYKHALKNSLIPVLTIVGMQIGYLLGGAVIVEEVFSLPGLGRLLLTAIFKRDYPVVMGTIIVVASIFALVNLVVDLLYAFLNPRIRY